MKNVNPMETSMIGRYTSSTDNTSYNQHTGVREGRQEIRVIVTEYALTSPPLVVFDEGVRAYPSTLTLTSVLNTKSQEGKVTTQEFDITAYLYAPQSKSPWNLRKVYFVSSNHTPRSNSHFSEMPPELVKAVNDLSWDVL